MIATCSYHFSCNSFLSRVTSNVAQIYMATSAIKVNYGLIYKMFYENTLLLSTTFVWFCVHACVLEYSTHEFACVCVFMYMRMCLWVCLSVRPSAAVWMTLPSFWNQWIKRPSVCVYCVCACVCVCVCVRACVRVCVRANEWASE